MIADFTDFTASSTLPGFDHGRGAPDVEALIDRIIAAGRSKPKPQDDLEKEIELLPGPKKRQAESLFQNVNWLCRTFDESRIGFLTVTMGKINPASGKFEPIKDRKKAGAEWNNLLTGVIKRRYRCGVSVAERHKNGGIHYHLLVVCPGDIQTGIDYEAVFPPKNESGGYKYAPDYSTAPPALKAEWEFWRGVEAKSKAGAGYEVGRCQMQPLRKNGEAVSRYIAKYITKNFASRKPEDKGWRMLRYFGHWSFKAREYYAEKHDFAGRLEDHKKFSTAKAARDFAGRNWPYRAFTRTRMSPPISARHGGLGIGARLWREMCQQVQVVTYNGIREDNTKDMAGARWAWNWAKMFKATLFYDMDYLPDDLKKAINDHNFNVEKEWGHRAAWIIDRKIEHWMQDEIDDGEPDLKDLERRLDNYYGIGIVSDLEHVEKTRCEVIGGIIHHN